MYTLFSIYKITELLRALSLVDKSVSKDKSIEHDCDTVLSIRFEVGGYLGTAPAGVI